MDDDEGLQPNAEYPIHRVMALVLELDGLFRDEESADLIAAAVAAYGPTLMGMLREHIAQTLAHQDGPPPAYLN